MEQETYSNYHAQADVCLQQVQNKGDNLMIHFGTGGWRAVIGEEFTRANLELLAQALSDKMKEECVSIEGMVIGYDRRFLSRESMQWMAQVFAKNGIKAMLIDKSCPTPLVMFYVQQHDLHYGLMITASHNPAVYNGVKVFTKGGRDADLAVTADIEAYIARVQQPVETMDYDAALKKALIAEFNPINDYLDSILSDINVSEIRKANLHVALDPMYGVSETSIKTILITARCDVDIIHGRHDPLFGGHTPAPDSDAMKELGSYTVMHGYDMGVATDGDADRISVVDDTGRYLAPDDLLVILYWYLIQYRGMHGPCVRNLCTTHRLDRIAEKYHEQCYEVPVGFKWISAKMDETHAIIGGESSGGLAIQGRIKGKDGVYAAALLTEMLAVTGMKMSEIYSYMEEICGSACMAEHSYRFKPELKEEFKHVILEEKKIPELPYETDHVSYMDGCKLYFKNGGWLSIRFSGTEPLLRVFAEMPTQQDAENVCKLTKKFLNL